MIKFRLVLAMMMGFTMVQAQIVYTDSLTNEPLNTAGNIIKGNSSKNITVSGYGQIDYNQPLAPSVRQNGTLDVHRIILFLGYKFNERTHFVTEIEFEHVNKVEIEQAFINHRFNPALNFRAGLMLIPMGIVNEYHETPTFNGVERPNLDTYIVPSTWREIGFGFSGNLQALSVKYQAYVMNGFSGYNGAAQFDGRSGFLNGKQKGANSYISSPNLSTKIDYYGISGLKLGLAGYFGKSQSTAFNNLDRNDASKKLSADSTVVNISMIGLDFRYQKQGFTARGQVINANVGNTLEYNAKTGSDMAANLFGYYVEVGYDVLRIFQLNTDKALTAFVRYEKYDTHHQVTGEVIRNSAYDRTDITMGLTFKLAPGAVLKGDYQIKNTAQSGFATYDQLNLGIGIWF